MARLAEIGIIIIVIISVASSIYLYPTLPEEIPSHWNAAGEVDGYMAKEIGIFLIPVMILLIGLLLIAIPRIDPLRKNIEKFRNYYDGMIILFGIYMLWIHIFILLWSIGIMISVALALSPAFAALFFYIGIMLEKSKRNWFVGIRTPWTLSSDRVWDKTHKLGGKLFKLSGLVALLGIILPDYSILIIVGPVLLTTGYTIVYSYFEYNKEKKGKKK